MYFMHLCLGQHFPKQHHGHQCTDLSHLCADPVDRAKREAGQVKDKAKEEGERVRQGVDDKAQKITGRK